MQPRKHEDAKKITKKANGFSVLLRVFVSSWSRSKRNQNARGLREQRPEEPEIVRDLGAERGQRRQKTAGRLQEFGWRAPALIAHTSVPLRPASFGWLTLLLDRPACHDRVRRPRVLRYYAGLGFVHFCRSESRACSSSHVPGRVRRGAADRRGDDRPG